MEKIIFSKMKKELVLILSIVKTVYTIPLLQIKMELLLLYFPLEPINLNKEILRMDIIQLKILR